MGKSELTNRDLIEFKTCVFGSGRGTIKPFIKCFGMTMSTWYGVTNNPNNSLKPWYAAMLRTYLSLDQVALRKTMLEAHAVDLLEVRTYG
ncbi:hypothetical protein CWC12_10295 [Pseudoalteromonas ruthenica]|nr:hypothetical protein CWC12_10295 [Pseudoalteromonas ruthenica]TMP22262.1 hypothetical protein CWC06_15715 [Pseudoalteromonas ruthenica]